MALNSGNQACTFEKTDMTVETGISFTSNFNEDGDNVSSVKNPTLTNSSQADIMYAEVGIKSADKEIATIQV